MDNEIVKHGACPACKATGLYVGMGERDGFSVVCSTCKGTGEKEFRLSWDNFNGRQGRPDVVRVLRVNPGICVGTEPKRGLDHSSFGGMSYADWKSGVPFPVGTEDREHTCPAWFYQIADYERKPDWGECLCAGSFPSCKRFSRKWECWERFDAEEKP